MRSINLATTNRVTAHRIPDSAKSDQQARLREASSECEHVPAAECDQSIYSRLHKSKLASAQAFQAPTIQLPLRATLSAIHDTPNPVLRTSCRARHKWRHLPHNVSLILSKGGGSCRPSQQQQQGRVASTRRRDRSCAGWRYTFGCMGWCTCFPCRRRLPCPRGRPTVLQSSWCCRCQCSC